MAEEIRCHPNTIRNAIRAKGLLNAAALWCLCEKFPGFETEIYGEKPSAAERELQVLRDEISRLANAAANGGLRAVPKEGKV